MDERFKNQSGIIEPHKLVQNSFTVIGAGAIGSFFTMTLAKMGATNIMVFDPDTIELHNISNQMYPHTYITQPKVRALEQVVKEYGAADIKWVFSKTNLVDLIPGGVIVCAVDSMDTRKELWQNIKKLNKGFYIDGRMGAQMYKVFGVDLSSPKQKAYYESTITSSAQAMKERCTQKSIIYTVLGVAAEMLNQVKKYLNNERRPVEVVYDFVNNIQTTEVL